MADKLIEAENIFIYSLIVVCFLWNYKDKIHWIVYLCSIFNIGSFAL